MGGPGKLEEVEIFLKNMFNDPFILSIKSSFCHKILAFIITFFRKKKAEENYLQIGGASPINAQKTVYDINKKTLQSDFSVDIQDLSKLEAIIHQKLKGSLAANGEFKFEDEKIEFLNADIKGFGGNILANLKDSKLNAKLNNLELSNLIALANMPAFANGKINGDVKIDDIYNTSKITGGATIAVNDGKISQKEFAKLTNINVADNTAFALNSDAKVDSGDIKSEH